MTTTLYVYEGNEILLKERMEGSTWKTGQVNVRLGGMEVGRYVKDYVGNTERLEYVWQDNLGSRRAVTDTAGAVKAKIDYGVWGGTTVTNYNGYDGSQDVSYTGKERDATGLYYYNARYYDCVSGRFYSEDPVRDGGNWFVYCGNNPLSATDPDGLAPVTPTPALGVKAHLEIIQRLVQDYGGRPQLYLPTFDGSKKGSFFVDYSKPEQSVTEMYEIKPISYMDNGKGDAQLSGYVDRAQQRGISAVKGTSLLDLLNGKEIPTMMMAGELDYGKGKITLSTDEENHPGMIFYSLDNGFAKETNKVQQVLDKVFESLRVVSPTGSTFSLPALAPAY